MNALLRTFGVFFIFGLLALGIFGIRYACSPRELLSVIDRAEEVERVHEAMLRHQEGQYQAAQEWLTQRSTWEETLLRLQEVDQEMDEAYPGYTRMLEETAKQSGAERHYQFILHYIKTLLRERPEELTVVLRRLEKDSQRSSVSPQRQQG